MQPSIVRSAALVFSLFGLGMVIYVVFISSDERLKEQGIYWFIAAIVSSLLPVIGRLKFKDLEVEFKQEIQKIKGEVIELKSELYRAVEKIDAEEGDLTAEQVERRNKHWDDFDAYVSGLPPEQKLETQRKNSLIYVADYGLSVRQIQENLAALGYYSGALDDIFGLATASAIERFQRRNNLRHVDGVFGPLTLKQISSKIAELKLDS